MHGTSADYLTDWLGTVLDAKSPRTRESYAHVTRRLFAFLEAGHHPTEFDELRPLHLRAFFASLRSEGASPNTIANFDRTLRAIFARIDREGREDFDLPAGWKNPLAPIEKKNPCRSARRRCRTTRRGSYCGRPAKGLHRLSELGAARPVEVSARRRSGASLRPHGRPWGEGESQAEGATVFEGLREQWRAWDAQMVPVPKAAER